MENEVTDEADHNLLSLVTDLDHMLREIEEHYGPKPTVGVYHSLSALTSLLSSSQLVVKSFDRRAVDLKDLCCPTHLFIGPERTLQILTRVLPKLLA